MSKASKSTVLKRAKELLQSGINGTIHKSGRIGQPIPVQGSDRGLHSWFVPVTVDELLVGFFQLQPDLTLLRYSSFQRHEDSLEGCPTAESWIDPQSIQRRIDKKMRQGEKVRELFLTYDKTPSRLCWAVVIETPGGSTRTLHVAGDIIWEDTMSDTGENSFDG